MTPWSSRWPRASSSPWPAPPSRSAPGPARPTPVTARTTRATPTKRPRPETELVRRNLVFLVLTLVIIGAAFGATLAAGHEPVLGLDLQGGVSVVLQPVGTFKSDALDVAVDVIRNRVDSLGVSEPEISRQGSDIVVDLPGVKDRAKAERLVGQTAELRFRQVIAVLPAEVKTPSTTTTTGAPGASTTTTTTTVPVSNDAAKAAVASCDVNQLSALPRFRPRPAPTTSAARAWCSRDVLARAGSATT